MRTPGIHRRLALQVLPLLVLLGAGAACGSVQKTGTATTPPPPATVVRVRNERLQDFNVYVRLGRRPFLLGIVPGTSTRAFTVPSHLILSEQDTVRFGIENIIPSEPYARGGWHDANGFLGKNLTQAHKYVRARSRAFTAIGSNREALIDETEPVPTGGEYSLVIQGVRSSLSSP